MYTVHNIPGSQYLEYVDPVNFLLVLCSFVFTGFRVDHATPPQSEHGLFAPVFILHCRYRYRYRYRTFCFFGSVTIMIVIVIVIEVILALSYRKVFGFDIRK